ncbi:MAG TPA: carboxypeptidase-like regulatory domain-containing protein [Terriglobia bacterium]|nr:carboxypeptidase-like regulatory domain-containing protein [Terriglobia bacterium]
MDRIKRSRINFFTFLLLLAVGLTIGSGLGWAQAGLATLSGTATDPSGSVIPGVSVTAINTNTGVTYRSESNPSGLYYIGALPPGPYKITAEKTGFKQWTRTVQLEVSQNASIDFRMEVGSTTTVVEVTGAPPILNTTGTAVGDVKDYQRINQLPLNGRQVTNLFDLTPGVEGGGNARVNGMKVGSMGIQMDGITERDRFGGGMVRIQPDIQDVQEFSIDTSGTDAKYDSPSTVILKTRSGTNQLHGEAFETHRNNTGGLLARERQQAGDEPFPKDIRNEFGGDLGGPVVIPHVYNGKDKTFFFFSYEGYREVGRANEYGGITPTPAMWNGDVSNDFDTSSGAPVISYDPTTTDANGIRQPFPAGIIPPSSISPIAKKLMAITAPPSNTNNPYIANNLTSVYPTFSDQNKITGKVDENFSAKDRVSARWSRQTWYYSQAGGHYGNPYNCPNCGGTSLETSEVMNVNVDYTRTLSNSMLNQLILGVLRTPTSSGTLGNNTDWADMLGLPNPFGVTGWPTIYADNFPWDADNRKDEHQTTYIAEDNFTWVKGKHTLELGGYYDKDQNNVRELQQAMGSHNFGPEWTCQFDGSSGCLPDTGNGFAALLLGLPDYLSNQYNRGYYYFRQNHFAWYVNDKWRVTSRLTLNFGVRWDKWTPYAEKQNRIDTAPLDSILNTFQVITPGNNAITSLPGIPPAVLQSYSNRGLNYSTADAYGYPSALFSQDNNNFGPRLGAAFKINDKTVIRGGYGIYYWPTPLSQILQTSRTNPPLNLRFQNLFQGPGVFGEGTNGNYMFITNPGSPSTGADYVPNASVDTNGVVPISPSAQSIFPYDGRNWQNDKMQNWNVTLERELPYRMSLRLTYTGNHGSDMEQRVALNNRTPQLTYVNATGQAPAADPAFSNCGCTDFLRPNPQWNVAYGYMAHNGISNNNSIQAQVERKYHNGMVFQWFYVYDHGLTTTDAGGYDAGNLGGFNNGGNPGLGGSGGALIPENSIVLGQPNLSFDQLQRLVYSNMVTVPVQHYGWNGLVDLPFGKGKKFLSGASGPLNQLVGGWQMAFIGDWYSGFWQSVNTSYLTTGNPNLSPDQRLIMNYGGDKQELWFAGHLNLANASNVQGGMQALTNLVGADGRKFVSPYGPDCSGNFSGSIGIQNTVLDNSGTVGCYNVPTSDFFHGSPRGSILGPSAFTMDASMFKNFSVTERVKIRFTADFFNVFNHPTNHNPNSSTGLIDLSTQANQPRLMQFSLHVLF